MKYGITLVSHVEEIAHGLPKLLKQVARKKFLRLLKTMKLMRFWHFMI